MKHIYNDSHYHYTDFIQRETNLPNLLTMMGDDVGRTALMGIPLQQKWDWFESGSRSPKYYLRSNARLYYYPFVDAVVARSYLNLSKKNQARFDPMITGFNPTDMRAIEHIERVMRLYPGVFSGIGEFSIHKEVVSTKIVGHPASLRNPALYSILKFAGKVGMLVVIHSDADVMLNNDNQHPVYFDKFIDMVESHPNTTIVWAHCGLGRFIEPVRGYVDLIREAGEGLNNLYFDLSWNVVAKHIIASPEKSKWIDLVNDWPDRFMIGSDSVVSKDRKSYIKNLMIWQGIFDHLDDDVSEKFRLRNYERLFDTSKRNIRKWENKNK